MQIAERFLSGLVKDYGRHPVSTDGGGTWYPMACQFLELDHYIHYFLDKKREKIVRKEDAIYQR